MFVTAVLVACGARSGLPGGEAAVNSACSSNPPVCVVAGSWCSAPTTVSAFCDKDSQSWSCPSGSTVYARAATSTRCLPFHGEFSAITSWGIGSFTRIPADDGTCLWVVDDVVLKDGTPARNVALRTDPNLPFGTCPDRSLTLPVPIVTMEGSNDPTILVQLDGGYRLGGSTRVLYRLFRLDPTATFGVRELGGGVAHFDASGRILIPSPQKPFPWGLDLDLGDAIYPFGDDAHELVWGCGTPGNYPIRCNLARLSADDAVELLSNAGDWIASVRASDGPTLFETGRWMSTIVSSHGSLRHLYIPDFTRSISWQTATAAVGPWSSVPGSIPCDLPDADQKSICAAVVHHPDISDPTQPNEVPVTYAVGSTGTRTDNPDDYWPRLVWLN